MGPGDTLAPAPAPASIVLFRAFTSPSLPLKTMKS